MRVQGEFRLIGPNVCNLHVPGESRDLVDSTCGPLSRVRLGKGSGGDIGPGPSVLEDDGECLSLPLLSFGFLVLVLLDASAADAAFD